MANPIRRRFIASAAAAVVAVLLAGPAGAADLTLTFAVGGVVTEVLVKPGDAVQAGAPLAKLDTVPLEARKAAAQARLAAAQAHREATKGALERVLERYEAVAANGQQVEEAKLADADAAADEARAQARLTDAAWKLDHAVLRAPLAGTVTAVPGHLGQVVNPRHWPSPVVVVTTPD